MNPVQSVSLLWPLNYSETKMQNTIAQSDNFLIDIDFLKILNEMSIDKNNPLRESYILLNLCTDAEIIRYRQKVIQDLLTNEELVLCLQRVLPMLEQIKNTGCPSDIKGEQLLKVVQQLGILDLYVTCICDMHSTLQKALSNIKSEAFIHLYQMLSKIVEEQAYKDLKHKLPALKEQFEKLRSVTLGINLDAQFRAKEAVLLSINEDEFKGGSLFDLLLKKRTSSHKNQGISPVTRIERTFTIINGVDTFVENAFQVNLFKQVDSVIGSVAKPVAASISDFLKVSWGASLSSLTEEVGFLIGAVGLVKKISQTGLNMCMPDIAPIQNRIFSVNGIYNLSLAINYLHKYKDQTLTQKIVTNDIDMGHEGRIFILTGPNQGGKTTYIQAIGQVQLLAQLGLPIPGEKAEISPADNIYTHFPVDEKPDSNMGRLGEESKRLSDIFDKATSLSMILLNESISSTSPGEGLYISREILCVIKILSARAVFATHLHDLAEGVDEINKIIPGDSKLVSMVSSAVRYSEKDGQSGESIKRTYKIIPGPPKGVSYARDISSKYGISFDKLVSTLINRGIVDKDLNVNSYDVLLESKYKR